MTDKQIKQQVQAIHDITEKILSEGKDSCLKFLEDAGILSTTPKEQANNWISVKERLPEHNEPVMIAFDTKGSDWYRYPLNIHLAYFHIESDFKKWFKDKSSLHEINSREITHWQPLPSPPKN